MKDKLRKHGKTKNYFRFRLFLIVSSLVILAGATVAIPVTISYVRAAIQQRSN